MQLPHGQVIMQWHLYHGTTFKESGINQAEALIKEREAPWSAAHSHGKFHRNRFQKRVASQHGGLPSQVLLCNRPDITVLADWALNTNLLTAVQKPQPVLLCKPLSSNRTSYAPNQNETGDLWQPDTGGWCPGAPGWGSRFHWMTLSPGTDATRCAGCAPLTSASSHYP